MKPLCSAFSAFRWTVFAWTRIKWKSKRYGQVWKNKRSWTKTRTGSPNHTHFNVSLRLKPEPPRIASGEWLVFCQLRSREAKQAWQRYPFHSQFAQYLVIGRHSATREEEKRKEKKRLKPESLRWIQPYRPCSLKVSPCREQHFNGRHWRWCSRVWHSNAYTSKG